MIENRAYRDLQTSSKSANNRYELLRGDFSRIYRLHHKANGIDVSRPAEQNVHGWMDCDGPYFKPEIHDAVFYYTPRTEQNDRFKACICTKDMEAAAWQHVHGSQLIFDGTFGLSSSRLLLWIAMGVDPQGHGVPVALFLFSAPTGNRATHAGYNTAILTELLGQWKSWMSRNKPSESDRPQPRSFEPAVAITDTDIKERAALITTWPKISLLLCKFHVRQCWTNKRNQLVGKGSSSFWASHVRTRLQTLEQG